MEFLHKKRAQNLLSIYKSEVLNTSIENEIVLDLFQKSQREGLVQKKVAIKTKNGPGTGWVDKAYKKISLQEKCPFKFFIIRA